MVSGMVIEATPDFTLKTLIHSSVSRSWFRPSQS